MWRSGVLVAVMAFLLAGCDFNFHDEDKSSQNLIDVSTSANVDGQGISLAPLGDPCGSKIETLCDDGLFCDYSAGKTTGICAPKEVNPNITCDARKEPVCAQKGRQRLGYLNECEARRHGAEILNEGFCLPEEITGSCADKVYSLGNCADEFDGVEYNTTEGECVMINVRGCEAAVPFESLETCQSSCLNAVE